MTEKIEQDLIEQFTKLNDLRLENKIERSEYLYQFAHLMNVANVWGIKLFKEAK